jgi:GNAT superfamily N-acetyltransferase
VPVRIRLRAAADLPRLVEVLGAQQPISRYPIRWPLPVPPEEFVARDGELGAWVAEVEGTVVGHVSLLEVQPGWEADGFEAATGLPRDRMASVSGLFVDPGATGLGVGTSLLEAALERARELGRFPVLDVAAQHERAVALYRRHGWSVVGETWPDWLPDGFGPFLVMTPPAATTPP